MICLSCLIAALVSGNPAQDIERLKNNQLVLIKQQQHLDSVALVVNQKISSLPKNDTSYVSLIRENKKLLLEADSLANRYRSESEALKIADSVFLKLKDSVEKEVAVLAEKKKSCEATLVQPSDSCKQAYDDGRQKAVLSRVERDLLQSKKRRAEIGRSQDSVLAKLILYSSIDTAGARARRRSDSIAAALSEQLAKRDTINDSIAKNKSAISLTGDSIVTMQNNVICGILFGTWNSGVYTKVRGANEPNNYSVALQAIQYDFTIYQKDSTTRWHVPLFVNTNISTNYANNAAGPAQDITSTNGGVLQARCAWVGKRLIGSANLVGYLINMDGRMIIYKTTNTENNVGASGNVGFGVGYGGAGSVISDANLNNGYWGISLLTNLYSVLVGDGADQILHHNWGVANELTFKFNLNDVGLSRYNLFASLQVTHSQDGYFRQPTLNVGTQF